MKWEDVEHNIRRFVGVIAVAIIAFGPFFMGYQWGMKRGMVKGINEGLSKCKTTYEITGPTTIESPATVVAGEKKINLLGISIWRLGLNLNWLKAETANKKK
jgi:hypothetical protein